MLPLLLTILVVLVIGAMFVTVEVASKRDLGVATSFVLFGWLLLGPFMVLIHVMGFKKVFGKKVVGNVDCWIHHNIYGWTETDCDICE